MGKKTIEKVETFRSSYDQAMGFVVGYKQQIPNYTGLMTKLARASAIHQDGTPIPAPLQKLIDEVEAFTKKPKMIALVAGAELSVKNTEKALLDLSKWVGEKSKKDPTTWRKIKDALKR